MTFFHIENEVFKCLFFYIKYNSTWTPTHNTFFVKCMHHKCILFYIFDYKFFFLHINCNFDPMHKYQMTPVFNKLYILISCISNISFSTAIIVS